MDGPTAPSRCFRWELIVSRLLHLSADAEIVSGASDKRLCEQPPLQSAMMHSDNVAGEAFLPVAPPAVPVGLAAGWSARKDRSPPFRSSNPGTSPSHPLQLMAVTPCGCFRASLFLPSARPPQAHANLLCKLFCSLPQAPSSYACILQKVRDWQAHGSSASNLH